MGQIRRRQFLIVGGALLGAPYARVLAQQPQPAVVGVICSSQKNPYCEVARKALEELGNKSGRSIRIEMRFWEAQPERLPKIADDLVRLRPDVLLTFLSLPARAAMRATSTIPIVFASMGSDPVAFGLVSNLARPTGNVTGLTNINIDLGGKQLQLLAETLPKGSRIGALFNPNNPGPYQSFFSGIEEVARTLAIKVARAGARTPEEIEPAFAALARESVQGLLVPADGFLFLERTRIMTLALKNRMATMAGFADNIEDGGLMACGTNLAEHYKQSVVYVDKILKGAKPSELPVVQPTGLEITINMKTAKLLGINVPRSVLVRADRVIE